LHTTQLDEPFLEAAARVIAERGIERATLERIASEAGLSRVTLHRRGITKEAILAALYERAVDEYRRAIWPALVHEGSGRERLELALRRICDVAEAHLGILLAAGTVRDAVFHQEGEDALTRSPFTEPLERLLRDGAADGSLRQLHPEEAATVVFNLVGQTYMHLRAGHRWNPDRACESIVDILIGGLRAK
jgi:AcrR family transcriptional regulator